MKNRKKILGIGLAITALTMIGGCGNSNGSDKIEKRIQAKREAIARLEVEIHSLENQLQKQVSTAPDRGVPVVTKSLQPQSFEHFILVNGTVEAVKEAFISPELNGQIKRIHVSEGDIVTAGNLLVSLNSSVIERSIAEVETQLELASTIYAKRKGLWEKKIGSEIQFLEARNQKKSLENKLETLQAQLEMTRIKAPIQGIVDQIASKEGELAAPGQLLIQLVCLDELTINADVSEAYLPNIRKDGPAEVSFPSFPEMKVNTRIHRIGNTINPQNRTFEVQIHLRNEKQLLKPNMLALLKLRDFQSDNALVIPSILIKNDRQGAYVFLMEKGEDEIPRARKVYVKAGMTQGSQTMITEGLSANQMLIVQGYNLVKNGASVRLSSSPPPEGSDQ